MFTKMKSNFSHNKRSCFFKDHKRFTPISAWKQDCEGDFIWLNVTVLAAINTFGIGLQCLIILPCAWFSPSNKLSVFWALKIFGSPDWQNSAYSIWNTYEENPTRSLLYTKVYTYLGCLMIHVTYDTEINLFYVLRTVYLSIILVINQLNAQNLVL